MHAFVYKSLRLPDTYLYLREKDAFAVLPAAVQETLGGLRFVLSLSLAADRKLAGADIAAVRANLAERGFHMQPRSNAIDPLVAGGVGDG